MLYRQNLNSMQGAGRESFARSQGRLGRQTGHWMMMETGDEWICVAEVAGFENGEVRGVDVAGRLIALYRLDDGSFFATDDICTHEYARLSEGWLEGDVIECPLHAGQFNVRDGAPLCAPATAQLECFPVRVTDERLWIKLPVA